jgi:hypothetical protein
LAETLRSFLRLRRSLALRLDLFAGCRQTAGTLLASGVMPGCIVEAAMAGILSAASAARFRAAAAMPNGKECLNLASWAAQAAHIAAIQLDKISAPAT